MKICMFLSAFFYSFAMYGQAYIPIKEMLSNYKEKKETKALSDYDIIYGFEESSEPGIFMELSLLPSDLPKMEGFRAEWCFEHLSGSKPRLYLKKVYSTKEDKKGTAAMFQKKLVAKYGKDNLGIPALWYSGKIKVLSCPRKIFGEIVAKSVIEFELQNGEVISRKSLKNTIKTGKMESFRRSRPNSNREYFPIVTLDGCWYKSLQYKLDLLEEFINGSLEKPASSIEKIDLDFLLVTDKQGKATGYLLSPEKMKNKKEQMLAEQLINRISELPRWSFGWLWTIDGSIFQGRYIKAVYSSDTGWKFKDYLH